MNAPQYNGGQYCGQSVTITNLENGNTQTATVADECPGCSWGSLDMSTGLFSALSNGNMGEGVFPISWSFGSGSAAVSSNHQQQQEQQQAASTSSTYTPQATYTKTWSQSPSATPTPSSVTWSQPAPTSTTSYAPQPSTAANSKTVVSTPEWWANIDNACGFTLAPASLPIAISGSALLSADKLSSACGKWIQVKNNQNGKELSVQVVNYWNGAEGDVAMGEAYKRLANNYENPEVIESITWGFIDGQGM